MMEPKYTNTTYTTSGTTKYITWWSHYMRNETTNDSTDYKIPDGGSFKVNAAYGVTKNGVIQETATAILSSMSSYTLNLTAMGTSTFGMTLKSVYTILALVMVSIAFYI